MQRKERRLIRGCAVIAALLVGGPLLALLFMNTFTPYRLVLVDWGPILSQGQFDLAGEPAKLIAEATFDPGERLFVEVAFPISSPVATRTRFLPSDDDEPVYTEIPVTISVARLSNETDDVANEMSISGIVSSASKNYAMSSTYVQDEFRYHLFIHDESIVSVRSRVRILVSYDGPDENGLPCVVAIRKLGTRIKGWKIVDDSTRRRHPIPRNVTP